MGLACSSEADPTGATAAPVPDAANASALAALGSGFAVWESNRTGDWRLFLRRFGDTEPRRLTPDEPDLQHCCPHISPDGRRLVYLARPAPRDRYPETEVAGELRLLELDETGLPVGEARVLAPARTYGWGDRAAVWRAAGEGDGGDELVFVAADGRTALLDVDSGRVTPLTTEPRSELGWLLDPTLSWATHAAPVFAPYDRAARQVAPRPEMGGCEPYFSHDGRWGIFMPAGGGPIRRLDLATREIHTLIERDDPRLEGQGYLYFPMPSRDGRLLAFGASRGEHSHFTSDYDVFVVPTDPASLEPTGPPVRLTEHPSTDRYPDVHLAPLPLGRHTGEAPLTVTFPSLAGDAVRWDYGDGTTEETARGRHVYERPGTYTVTVASDDGSRRGLVVVREAAPPRVVRAVLRGAGGRAVVHFDEPVDAADARASLASGGAVAEVGAGDDPRSVVVRFGAPVTAADRLTLEGVRDRAGPAHVMERAVLPLEPPSWPASRADLLFLWRDAAADNRIEDPTRGIDRVDDVTPSGRAKLDRLRRMDVSGGVFTAPRPAARELVAAVRESFEVTLIATVTPQTAEVAAGRLAPLVEVGNGGGNRNLVLGQEGRHLVAWVRAASTGADASAPRVRLFEVEPGRPVHVAVTYEAGELRGYKDGRPVVSSVDIQGGLRPWKDLPLRFGAGDDWRGVIEGVALYARALPPGELAEDAARYEALRAPAATTEAPRRAAPSEPNDGGTDGDRTADGLVVRATLVAVSEAPTLIEISPYREALVVHEYRLDDTLSGASPGRRLRVARWAILDGETQPGARLRPGATERLRLSPLADNPQLESVFVKDTLDPAWDLEVFYGEVAGN